jgi:hypothetical protein
MKTKPNAVFLAALKTVEGEASKAPNWENKGFLPFMDQVLSKLAGEPGFKFRNLDVGDLKSIDLLMNEALSAYLWRLMPDSVTGSLLKLADHDNLAAFRQLAVSEPEKTEGLIKSVVSVYLESKMPDVRTLIQNDLKKYLQALRESARLLKNAFSMRIMEIADPSGPLMDSDDLFDLKRCLFQALAMVEYLDYAFDRYFAAIPSTRKKRGKAGHKVLFGLLISDLFEKELGAANDKITADLIEVLFNTKDSKDRDNIRFARSRWKARRSSSDDFGPYQAAIAVILNDEEN